MSFTACLLAAAIGMIPGTVLYSYVGHLGSSSAETLMWTLAATTTLGLVVLLLKPRSAKRLASRGRRR